MGSFAVGRRKAGFDCAVLGIGIWCAVAIVSPTAHAYLNPEPPSAAAAAAAPQGSGRSWRVVRQSGPLTTPLEKLPRRLVLKLRATAAEACLSCALARQESLGQVVPGSRLDELNRRFGASAARPLMPAHAHKLIPERREALFARSAEVGARFPLREARAPNGATTPDFSRIYVLDVRRRPDLDQVARAYAADPAVEYCEPDYIVEAAFTPNDPYFASRGSWGQDFDDLWGVKKIEAPTAWDTTRGAGVTVAVVDSGIDYTHPDIAENMWTNPGEIPNNGIDDDGNGYVDDVYGWNFASNTSDPMDDMFHGTHVAGTIAATGNNGIGVIGVAFESRVMAVKALDRYGYGANSDLAQAIVYAVDNGADVINASWGSSGSSQLISDAIAYAHAHGVVFVAAAGNDKMDTAGFFPANDPNAITVAATTHLDEQASFSDFGLKLDVAAPGGGDGPPPKDSKLPMYSVLSLLSSAADPSFSSFLRQVALGTAYARLAGTSMAAPHVAGTAALLLAAHPDWSVEQIRQALRSTADDLGDTGPDPIFGYGRINAARAVAAPAPLTAHISSPVDLVLIGQTTVAITGSAAGPGFDSYTLEYGPAPNPAAWTPIASASTPVDEGLLASWDVTEVPDGDYVIRLRVDRTGQEFSDAAAVTFRNIAIDSPPRLAAYRPDRPIEVRGTAAGAGFVSYKVEYVRGQDPATWRGDGITLAVSPDTPVRNGLLATFDPSGVTTGDQFNFRLTVVNGAGTNTWVRGGIVIDPSLRAGWPQPLVPVSDRDYLTVADLDGDGKKEILVGSGDEVVVFEPDGSVRPGWPQSVAGPGNWFAEVRGSPIVADINGDGALEVIGTDHRRLFAWSVDGVSLPGFPRIVDAFKNSANAWLTAADLNGDGADEILCSAAGNTQAFLGDGSEVPGWNAVWFAKPQPWAPMAVGDVFGDSNPEVSIYSLLLLGRHARLTGARIGLYDSGRNLLGGWPQSAPIHVFANPAMADMNGDGQLEQFVLGEPLIINGCIKGPVSPGAWTPVGKRLPVNKLPWLRNAQIRKYFTNGLASFADLNRDGQAEAYVYASTQGVYAPLLGQFAEFRVLGRRRTPPTQRPPQLLPFSYRPEMVGSVAIGDIDGDGQQELVAGVSGLAPWAPGVNTYYLPQMAVIAAKADGTLLSQFPKPVPRWIWEKGDPSGLLLTIKYYYDDPRFNTPAIADLDGDGLKELIWVDPDTTLLMVWNVDGTPGPELADWPMYRHDPKHTNVLPVMH